MSESKIYMFPDNLQNNAAMWAALANKDLALPLAAMMNGILIKPFMNLL